eukprot:IDg10104t1
MIVKPPAMSQSAGVMVRKLGPHGSMDRHMMGALKLIYSDDDGRSFVPGVCERQRVAS